MMTRKSLKQKLNSNMPPNVIIFEEEDWPRKMAILFHQSIEETCQKNGFCNVMLTGGRSVVRVYKAWNKLTEFQTMTGVNFYFGDERCVPLDSGSSNYALVMDTLFKGGVPKGCRIYPMYRDSMDCILLAAAYEEILPKKLDIIILSLGEDGHIASIFPNSKSAQEMGRTIMLAYAPSPPYKRLTITPRVLRNAKRIYALALGSKKMKVLNRIFMDSVRIKDLPGKLIADATWLVNGLDG